MSQVPDEHPLDATMPSSSMSFPDHTRCQTVARPEAQPLRYPLYRPLRFWCGVTLDFKLLESVHALVEAQNSSEIGPLEKVTMHFDARMVLNDASEVVRTHRDKVIDQRNYDTLKTTLDRFRASIYDEWLQKYTNLQHAKPPFPASGLTRAGILDWYDIECAFAYFSHGMEEPLRGSRTRIFASLRSTRNHYLRIVDGFDATHPAAAPDARRCLNTPSPMLVQNVDIQTALLSTEECNTQRFRRITDIYRNLSLILDWSEQARNTNVERLSEPLTVIWPELANLLVSINGEASLKIRNPDSTTEALCEGWANHLSTLSRQPMQQILMQNFEALQNSLIHDAGFAAEAKFTAVARLAAVAAFTKPSGVCAGQWARFAPQMLEPQQYRFYINKLQYLHEDLQVEFYSEVDTLMLWLMVWRALRATYLLLRQSHFTVRMTGYPVETTFFQRMTVLNQFELVLSGPEALYPEVVENLVAEYCILIDRGLKSSGSQYAKLHLVNSATQPEQQVLDIITGFIQRPAWSDDSFRAIERCAMALNSATNGPSFLRRWNRRMCDTNPVKYLCLYDNTTHEQPSLAPKAHRGPESASESSGTKTNPSATPQPDAPSTAPTSVLPSSDAIPKPPPTMRWTETTNADAVAAQVPTSTPADGQNQSTPSITEPAGMNILSAFPYVKYPFPETRALEVAQSRQISREMSDPSLYSQGILVQDVVNVPPRHTWAPGQISIWAQYLPIGPLDVIKEVWTIWRGDNRKWKKLRKAKTPPRVTARTPRRDYPSRNPRAQGPLRDHHNRVARPHAHPHHLNVPKLRGGGPAASQATTDATHTGPSDQPNLDETEQLARTHRLVDRLRGCWRWGEMLSDEQIRDIYLIPNDWNVNAAHDSAIRSLNREFETPVAQVPERPNTVPFVQLGRRVRDQDPFTVTGDAQNTKSASEPYSLSSSQGAFLPWGRRGYRAPPTSPSPTPRRRRTLLEQQNLDPIIFAVQHPYPAAQFDTRFEAGAVFTHAGLPEPIQIWEDPPSQQEPVPAHQQPDRSFPAPNQDHQRQIERQGDGLPPRGSNDNDSNQENRLPSRSDQNPAPAVPQQSQSSQPPPRPATQSQQPPCLDGLCHPCPRFNGLFHHICEAQTSQIQHAVRSALGMARQEAVLRWQNPDSPVHGPTSPQYDADYNPTSPRSSEYNPTSPQRHRDPRAASPDSCINYNPTSPQDQAPRSPDYEPSQSPRRPLPNGDTHPTLASPINLRNDVHGRAPLRTLPSTPPNNRNQRRRPSVSPLTNPPRPAEEPLVNGVRSPRTRSQTSQRDEAEAETERPHSPVRRGRGGGGGGSRGRGHRARRANARRQRGRAARRNQE